MAREMGGYSPPCLADLDGDGKAEILMMGGDQQSVYAFRGDGRPFVDKPRGADEPWPTIRVQSTDGKTVHALDPKVPNERAQLERIDARERLGRIAILPSSSALGHAGVTAVDLGGDGVDGYFRRHALDSSGQRWQHTNHRNGAARSQARNRYNFASTTQSNSQIQQQWFVLNRRHRRRWFGRSAFRSQRRAFVRLSHRHELDGTRCAMANALRQFSTHRRVDTRAII